MRKCMGELMLGMVLLLAFTAAGCAEAQTDSDGETASTAGEESTTVLSGWITEDSEIHYYGEDGEMYADGWYTIEGDTYYFLAGGEVNYGWITLDDGTFYCDPETGARCSGWVTVDGDIKYYFSPDTGVMATELQEIDGKLYYFNSDGSMFTGWKDADGDKYYFDLTSGAAQTGWMTLDKKKYYFSETGVLQIGWVTMESSGKKYYFAPHTGVMVTGLQVVDGKMYYFNSDGSVFTGWKDVNDNKYYFNLSTGAAETGWSEIDGYTYYFNASGIMQTNKIAGSEQAGYYYVGDDGIRVTAEEITYAVEFVMAHSTSDASNAARLKECYDYLWNYYPYNRTYETPDASTMSDEAIAIFSNGYGNCYKYAAAFVCIAKVLGYDARVCVGEISSRKGGMTPHGWAEVESDGSWYLCDPDMQMNYPTRNVYMVTESEYPYNHNVTTKYTLTITNGEVSWE